MNSVKHVYTDGGREESDHADENQDCTVRALSIISDTPYNQAHSFLAALGRKEGRPFATYLAVGKIYNGKEFDTLRCPHSSVGRYISEHPTGNYILKISRHVFAVKDGVIFDRCSLDRLIRCPVKSVFFLKEVTPV